VNTEIFISLTDNVCRQHWPISWMSASRSDSATVGDRTLATAGARSVVEQFATRHCHVWHPLMVQSRT